MTLTVNKLLALLGLGLAILSFFIPGPLVVLAVICLALAMLIET